MKLRHTEVLFETIIDQNTRILEAAMSMQYQIADLPTRLEFTELKDDVKIIKHAVNATNKDLHQLEKRVTVLELAKAS